MTLIYSGALRQQGMPTVWPYAKTVTLYPARAASRSCDTPQARSTSACKKNK